jgi:hypothetical protein
VWEQEKQKVYTAGRERERERGRVEYEKIKGLSKITKTRN